jgi:hypothetical protein
VCSEISRYAPDHVGHQRQKGCEYSNPQGYGLCETLVREHGLLDQPKQGVGAVQAKVKKAAAFQSWKYQIMARTIGGVKRNSQSSIEAMYP